MRISGDQNSILEVLKMLDKNVKDPWGCRDCRHFSREIKTDCNGMICRRETKTYGDNYGFSNYILEIDYNGQQVTIVKELHKDHSNSNILSGTVK